MRSKLRLLYKLLRIASLFIAGLIIATLIFPAVNLLYSAVRARIQRDRLKKQWLSWFSAIVNLQIIRTGSPPDRTAILVSNHISWLDIIVIGQYLPAYFVAKSDIDGWPVIGFLSRQAGTIFIRRGDKKHIKETAEKMGWLLKQNRHIIAFPEGTTTCGDEVLNFHASLFQPAVLTKSAIQPVAIQYEGVAKAHAPFVGDDGFIPHLLKILRMDKIEVRLDFLPMISTLGKDRHAVSHEARAVVMACLAGDNAVIAQRNCA
jgi:1-acyl-sn-glycerol-3-phosphate acyltransferase